MANGYGSSSNLLRRSTTNAQGEVAPPGYHYMPDGSLMSDAEHSMLYDLKTISSFELDTSNIGSGGENREFNIIGDKGATFSLEIINGAGKYYNFTTNLFQTNSTRLSNAVISESSYYISISFPAVTAADEYDIRLFADIGTKHASYAEVRFEDGSIDINSSSGSNSLLMKKIIYQTLDVVLTLSTVSPTSVAGLSGHTRATQTITIPMGQTTSKIPFTIPVTAGATHSLRVDKAPTTNHFLAHLNRTIGSDPVDIYRENIYPRVNNTDTVDGAITGGGSTIKVVMDTNVADKMVVGDKITAAVSTDTVDGAVSSGVKVVMDNNVVGKMAIGDRITSSSASLASDLDFAKEEITVAALNPDGDNAKEFSMSRAVAVADGATLTFTPKCNRSLTTVVALNPDTDNVKEFSMSQNIGLRDGVTLSFRNRMNYRWPLDNIHGLSNGMLVRAGNVVVGTKIASYSDTTTVLEGTESEETITNVKIDPLEKLGAKPTISRDASTKIVTTTQTGNVTFDNQQVLALAGDTCTFHAYGRRAIKQLTNWDIELSDLAVTITKPSTTTSAVSDSASVPVANGDGIMDDVSTVSGIGIDPTANDPTVTNIASYSGTTATLTLSSPQTLESGATLTFDGAARIITISGNIEVKGSDQTVNTTLYFDLEKFITATDES